MYAKTVNLVYAGNKVFVKYQAEGFFNPPPLAYVLEKKALVVQVA